VLGGRRPFTLATIVRLEQALGASLRKSEACCRPQPWSSAASRLTASGPIRAVAWAGSRDLSDGAAVLWRQEAIYAYRTEIAWDDAPHRCRFARANGLMRL